MSLDQAVDSYSELRPGVGSVPNPNLHKSIVTEIKGSLEALHPHSEVEDFFDNGGIGLHLVGPHGTILRANRAELAMLGYSAEEYVGRNIAEFYEDKHVIEDILRRLMRGEKLDKYPASLVAKDGTFRHVLITSSAQFRDGEFINTRCFTLDVTGWKDAENALKEQDRLLSATYENADVGISQADTEGRLLRVNGALCKITGYSREELLQRSFFDLTYADDVADDASLYAQHLAGECEQYRIEKRCMRKDGTTLWVSVSSTLVRDGAGKIRCVVNVVQDINKQRVAEHALRNSERQFRQLLETLPAAIYTTDAKGRITFYNKAAEEMAGRAPVIGVDEWCVTWKLFWPDGTPLPHDQCPMAIALKENRAVRGAEAIAERPDGTRVPFIPFPTPLRDAAGNLVGAVNMLVDVSERKQAEANQKVLLDELNHRVKNNMQMLNGLIRASLRETTNSEARVVLADASQRVGAMAAAQQVLYESGSGLGFDAKQFLDTVCASAGQALGRNILVSIVEAPDDKLSNDAGMPLALVLNELITNAAKYGISGRGEGQIRVGMLREDDAFVLYVEDDGNGFEIEKVRKRASGLGLVSGLARQLGGTFEVRREPKTRCVVRFFDQHVVH
jgi:PAS domain S-box-containing protein